MTKKIVSKHITEVRNRTVIFIPSTIRYLQKSRINSDLAYDDITPKGLNFSIITLCAFYLEGCFESGIGGLCNLNSNLKIDLEKKLQEATSAKDYNRLFQEITNCNLCTELGHDYWEGLTQLEKIRGALAPGRAIVSQVERTIHADGENKFVHKFNGSYQKVFEYLIKRQVIEKIACPDPFEMSCILLENKVSDHFAEITPLISEKFRKILVETDSRAADALSDDASLWKDESLFN